MHLLGCTPYVRVTDIPVYKPSDPSFEYALNLDEPIKCEFANRENGALYCNVLLNVIRPQRLPVHVKHIFVEIKYDFTLDTVLKEPKRPVWLNSATYLCRPARFIDRSFRAIKNIFSTACTRLSKLINRIVSKRRCFLFFF